MQSFVSTTTFDTQRYMSQCQGTGYGQYFLLSERSTRNALQLRGMTANMEISELFMLSD